MIQQTQSRSSLCTAHLKLHISEDNHCPLTLTPVANDTYVYSGVTYAYDGQKWTSRGAQTGIALLPDEMATLLSLKLWQLTVI